MFRDIYCNFLIKKINKNAKNLAKLVFFSLSRFFFSSNQAQESFKHHIWDLLTCFLGSQGSILKTVFFSRISYPLTFGDQPLLRTRLTLSYIRSCFTTTYVSSNSSPSLSFKTIYKKQQKCLFRSMNQELQFSFPSHVVFKDNLELLECCQ